MYMYVGWAWQGEKLLQGEEMKRTQKNKTALTAGYLGRARLSCNAVHVLAIEKDYID